MATFVPAAAASDTRRGIYPPRHHPPASGLRVPAPWWRSCWPWAWSRAADASAPRPAARHAAAYRAGSGPGAAAGGGHRALAGAAAGQARAAGDAALSQPPPAAAQDHAGSRDHARNYTRSGRSRPWPPWRGRRCWCRVLPPGCSPRRSAISSPSSACSRSRGPPRCWAGWNRALVSAGPPPRASCCSRSSPRRRCWWC